MSPYLGLRNIILIGFLFGFHGIFNRSLLLGGVNEIFIVTARITLVTLLLCFYCFNEFKSEIKLEYFLKGSWTGFLAIFIPGWTFIFALKNISAGLQSILISTIPMFTIFWVYFFYKEEKITKSKVFSVAIGIVGLAALFISGATGLVSNGNLVLGGTLGLIGVQGLAISNITNKKDSQYIPAKTYLLTQWLFGSILSIVLFFILGGKIESLSFLDASKLLGLVFIDIFNYSLFFYTIKRLSATFTSLVDYIVPVFGISLGYFFLDEVVNNIFYFTLSMIFLSLFIAVKGESRDLR
jgi:drug/metabolite transporter (DMT)-like permease